MNVQPGHEPVGPETSGMPTTACCLRDTPINLHPLVACRRFDVRMAHPAWKGPREPVQLKLPKPEKDLLASRAQLAGLSYSEYVISLLQREPVDENGRPLWVAPAPDESGELPLAM